jgi:hypothetical protein
MIMSTSATVISSFLFVVRRASASHAIQHEKRQRHNTNQHTDTGIYLPIAGRKVRPGITTPETADHFPDEYPEHPATEKAPDNGYTTDANPPAGTKLIIRWIYH